MERTMKAWKIRGVIRDKEGIIIGYQREKTCSPELGKKMITRYPLEWEVTDRNWQVPADDRIAPRNKWRVVGDYLDGSTVNEQGEVIPAGAKLAKK